MEKEGQEVNQNLTHAYSSHIGVNQESNRYCWLIIINVHEV